MAGTYPMHNVQHEVRGAGPVILHRHREDIDRGADAGLIGQSPRAFVTTSSPTMMAK